jgi:hypothetical protein
VAIHPSERAAIEARGGKVDAGGMLQPAEGKKLCPFKTDEHLCGLHFTEAKPFGCRASPFTINDSGTLIVRNRYKLLRCYDDGKRQPAYQAFRASLDLIFGAEEAARICVHLDAGGGDLRARMPKEAADRLRFKNEASAEAVKAADPEAPAWARGIPLERLRGIATVFKAIDKPFVMGAFTGVKENQIAEWLEKGQLFEAPEGYAVQIKAKQQKEVRDFSGALIGIQQPGDLVIKRIAGSKLREVIEAVAGYETRCWLEIWQEHEPSRIAAKAAGFRWAGSKVMASSEIVGIWVRGFMTKVPIGPELVALGKLKATVPAEMLQAARDNIDRCIAEGEWKDHYSTYNKRKSWFAFSLRGYGGRADFIEKPEEMSKKWKEENPEKLKWEISDTPLRAKLPEVEKLVALVPGVKHRIRLMRLQPGGGELTRHADITDPLAGVRPGHLMRIHIPLQTNPGVIFRQWLLDGSQQAENMAEGEIWYLDTRKPHTARNDGAGDRIHLVMDTEACPALLAMLP